MAMSKAKRTSSSGGGGRNQNAAAAAVSLFMLVHRRKPSLLFDFCRFPDSGLDKLIYHALHSGCRDLHSGGRRIENHGVVLQLDGDDYVIAIKSRLLAHLNQVLDAPPVFLDLSGTGCPGSPASICSDNIVCDILNSVRELRSRLAAASADDDSGERLIHIDTAADLSGCNLATLFGVLLGYPVVYWFPPSQVGHQSASIKK